jgi:hypothetical protein
MGLDIVELVIECEEAFHIKLEDWRLGQMRTVGDLYELICEQLGLPFGPQEARPSKYLQSHWFSLLRKIGIAKRSGPKLFRYVSINFR